MKTFFLALIISIFFPEVSLAEIYRINVETTVHNQIDQGLILSSEHHFSKRVLKNEDLSEKLNENIEIKIKLTYEEIDYEGAHFISGVISYNGFSLKNDFLIPKTLINLSEKKYIDLKIDDKKRVDLSFFLREETFNVF